MTPCGTLRGEWQPPHLSSSQDRGKDASHRITVLKVAITVLRYEAGVNSARIGGTNDKNCAG
jgi:hypothetical protein